MFLFYDRSLYNVKGQAQSKPERQCWDTREAKLLSLFHKLPEPMTDGWGGVGGVSIRICGPRTSVRQKYNQKLTRCLD